MPTPRSISAQVIDETSSAQQLPLRASATSPAQPPDDDEEPEDEDEKEHVPDPTAALARGHGIQARESPSEDAARLCEGVVLHRTLSRALIDRRADNKPSARAALRCHAARSARPA